MAQISKEMDQRRAELRNFLAGGSATRPLLRLDPSSYAAVFAGKGGGDPTVADQIRFHRTFPNDAMPCVSLDVADVIPQLVWSRRRLREEADGSVAWEETLRMPDGPRRRVVMETPGTISWLLEPAVRKAEDFDLIDFHADLITENARAVAESVRHDAEIIREAGMMPGVTIFSAFEVYWLVAYSDMPLLYMDCTERYLSSVRRVHEANLALLEAMVRLGIEIIFTGSAGLELLSPRIFEEAIVPFQREFNNHARALGAYTSYHICGKSKRLILDGFIDRINATIFETCSAPPCGDVDDLRGAVNRISDEIITKGNMSLELLRDGNPHEIRQAACKIIEATQGRRHIVGQGDATILTGTPHENIEAFIEAAAMK